MIAVGSNDWDTILGANASSGDLLNYFLEINGVDYQITEIKIGDQSTSIFGGILQHLLSILLDILLEVQKNLLLNLPIIKLNYQTGNILGLFLLLLVHQPFLFLGQI